jgi:hypothetical protein
MSDNQEINIYNMYDYVTYEYDVNNKVMNIFWDNNNIELNKLIINDMDCFTYKHDNTKKYSCLWLDELKKYINYQEGDKIPLQVKSQYGYFHIFVNYDISRKFIMEEIGDDGCLHICPYGDVLSYLQGTPFTDDIYPILNICNCLYNDFMNDNDGPYVLK